MRNPDSQSAMLSINRLVDLSGSELIEGADMESVDVPPTFFDALETELVSCL